MSTSIERRELRLFVRIIHRRKALCINLPYKLYPDEWDQRRQDVIISNYSRRSSYLRAVSKSLVRVRKKIRMLAGDLEKKGEYTTRQLKNAYPGQSSTNGIRVYTEALSEELANIGKERTGRCYAISVERLIAFTGLSDISFEGIENSLIKQFERSLRKEGMKPNTISFYLCNLRSIYNKALKSGLFIPASSDPFCNVFTGKETTRKRALSKEEMSRVAKLELSDPALCTALNLFLFSFYARGMAFVDMAYLRKDDLRDGVISYRRKKTGQYLEIKVNSQMQGILQKFGSQTKGQPYLV